MLRLADAGSKEGVEVPHFTQGGLKQGAEALVFEDRQGRAWNSVKAGPSAAGCVITVQFNKDGEKSKRKIKARERMRRIIK